MIRRLVQLAVRNAKRHRAQAWAAAGAVAVATTVLAASLLAGAAAERGITEVAYDVLGATDETVRSEGDFFFPEEAADAVADEVTRRQPGVSVAPTAVHPVIARDTEGLTEPEAAFIGMPPDEPGFQGFQAEDGPVGLDGEGVLVTEDVAESLQIGAGDTVTLRYTLPRDPLVPEVTRIDGNLTGGGSAPGPVDAPDAIDPAREPATETYEIDVAENATRLVAALGWASPENNTDLDLRLEAPDGTTYADTNGTTGDPDAPVVLNATAQPGTWTVEVSSEAAAEQPFRLFVLELRPAYSLEELRQGREAIEQLGPAADPEDLAPTREVRLPVDAVVTGDGKGSFTGEPAIFAPLDRVQTLLDREGEVNLLRVSNPGDVREGLEQTPQVTPDLREALNATQADVDEPSVQALTVETSKADVVQRAEKAGSDFTRFLTTLSSFTIVAGLLLVVNLFTMLGQERRVELSVLRALGMKRRRLTGALTAEGTLYALPGAPIGALAGLGLAYVLVEAINRFVVGEDGLPIPFVVDWSTVLLSAVVGLVVTVAVVAITGARLARVDVASGLRDQDPPAEGGSSRWALGLLVGGAVVGALHLPTGFTTPLLVGPAAALAGGLLLVSRSWPRRRQLFAASLAVLAYGLWTVGGLELPPSEASLIVPLRGVLLVLCGVVALVNAPGLPTLLNGIATKLGSWSPAALVASSYPLRRPLRTGLTASMFALVLLVLIFFSTFFVVFEVDPAREAGGYDVYAETPLQVEGLEAWAEANLDDRPDSLDRIDTSTAMPVARVVGGDVVTVDGRQVQYNGPPVDVFYGTTEAFARDNGYELVARSDRFDSDRAAYQAVADGGDEVVVSRVYDVDENGRLGTIQGGETLTLDLTSRTYNFTVVGTQSQQYLGGIFLEPTTVEDLFPRHGTGMLITVEEGENPTEVARDLERDFAEIGLSAEDIRAEAREVQQLNARFYTVLQLFLGLGLVIGVASLGIVTAKSALDREHELGVLRAMGLRREHLTASLTLEGLVTALLGILPGLVVGVAAAYASYLAFFADAGIAFEVPWTSMLGLSLLSLGATLASTIPPARRAARQDVAQAVRVER